MFRTFNLRRRLPRIGAQLAYYLLLALVPAIVFLVALASFFPADTVTQMIASLRVFAPGDVVQIVQEQLQRVANGQQGGLLTLGIGMALWSSSPCALRHHRVARQRKKLGAAVAQ